MGRAKNIPAANTILLPYQAKWVRDKSRLKIAEKSRQIGWTWATAYGLTSRKALKSAALDAWISSRDDIQARLFLEDCKSFANVLKIAAKDLGESVVDEKGHTAYVLAMANSLRIHSMSSNPDAQAGKRGDRVLDEFALHPDPRKLYAIAYPGITWGGMLEIFSTHRGSGNYFNGLIREIREKGNPKGWSLHRVTLQDALDEGFLYKLQSKLPADDQRQDMDEAEYFDFIKRGAPDEESFLQEYMCVPADDASAFITWELIDGCTFREGEEWEFTIEQAARCENGIYGGLDIGRDHDLTSFTAVEKVAGLRPVRKRIDLKGMPFSEQKAILYPWFAVCKRVAIDRNGIGRQFAEEATQRFGTYKIEEYNFTNASKEELAYPLRSAFEDRSIRIPFEDDLLKSDLRAIRKETTSGGSTRFAADRGKNGHADRFWGLALAIHAAKDTRGNTAFDSLGGSGSKSGRGRNSAL
jgi:phage FluMu gp28-like protein